MTDVTKRVLAPALGTLLFGLCFSAHPEEAARKPRVAYLSLRAESVSNREAFRQGMRDLGYVEGQNIVIEYRHAQGKLERFSALAVECVDLKVDAIVTASAAAVLALRQATTTIPIIFAAVSDPFGSRIVAHPERPGGNVTGLASVSPELSWKRLALLKELVPEISRAGIVWDPSSALNVVEWEETRLAAVASGVDIRSLEVRRPGELRRAFDSAGREGVAGLIVLRNPLSRDLRKRVVELAAQNRLPAVYNDRGFVEAGGLVSYGTDMADLYRRAAIYVDRILKGAKPAELPVERPRKFELAINLKTAKQIGFAIPPPVLARADTVLR